MYGWDDADTIKTSLEQRSVLMYLLDFELAIDRMRERVTEAEGARRLALAGPSDHDAATMRRRLALALASVSRASAAGVRRLDACLADDLAGQFASNR